MAQAIEPPPASGPTVWRFYAAFWIATMAMLTWIYGWTPWLSGLAALVITLASAVIRSVSLKYVQRQLASLWRSTATGQFRDCILIETITEPRTPIKRRTMRHEISVDDTPLRLY
jgi:hypothetical protein